MPYTPSSLGGWCMALLETLSELANEFAASLDLRITEVRSEDDIDAVLEEVAPVQKVVIGELKGRVRWGHGCHHRSSPRP